MKTYVFTNRVYPPVGGATGELLKELVEGLVAGGARVIVVTSRGRDQGTKRRKDQETARGRAEGKLRDQETAEPAGQVAAQPTDKRPREETTKGHEVINGVEVVRVGTATFTRASHWRRALCYLGLYPQLMWQVWMLGRVDAVVSMTDPPLQVAAVTLASSQAKKRIHWAQDVYPELAEELGVLGKNGVVARALRAVSNWALRRQDKVVAVGRCMRERLVARGVDAKKIEVIPNWSPVGAVDETAAETARRKMGWGDEFVVMYSGNLGLAHDFETVVMAAKTLGDSGVRIVLAGEGPRLDEVRHAMEGLDHVSFLPSQRKAELGEFLAAADAHLVTVRAGLEGLVVPSKAYGVMAAGRPIFYVGPTSSELARLLADSKAGAVIANGDGATLASALRAAATNRAEVRSMGQAARESARQFTFAKALAKWQEVLG
jgi:glycosyltransferase involved in cell wall biosynthesis